MWCRTGLFRMFGQTFVLGIYWGIFKPWQFVRVRTNTRSYLMTVPRVAIHFGIF